MKFSRVKYKDEKFEARWTTPNAPADVEDAIPTDEVHELSCADEPEPRFQKALQALAGDLCYLLELPDKYRQKVTITTVNLSEDRNGNVGYQISGVAKVGAGSWSLTTPRMREPTEETPEGATTLTKDQVKRVQKVLHGAARYVDGMRTQRDLFADQEEGSEETVGAEA